MTAKDILVQARGYIEKGWCKGYEATTSSGIPVSPVHPGAAHWDIYGSLKAALGVEYLTVDMRYGEPAAQAERLLREVVSDDFLASWQDARTKEEVLAAFDKAIELADKEAE